MVSGDGGTWPVTIRIDDPGRGAVVEELGQLQGGEIRQVTLRLRARGTARVTGTVLWDDARPAEGVLVGARDRDPGRGPAPT